MKNPLKNIKIPVIKKTFQQLEDDRRRFVPLKWNDYVDFCKRNNFKVSNDKDLEKFKREESVYRLELKAEKIKTGKEMLSKKKAESRKLKKIAKDSIPLLFNSIPSAKDFYQKMTPDERDVFDDLALALKKNLYKLAKNPINRFSVARREQISSWDVLQFLVQYKPYWLRNLEDFIPKSHNAWQSLWELVNHLTVKNEIPKGLYSLLSYGSFEYFFKVASGGSPQEGIPTQVHIPKSQAPLLLKFLKKYDWGEAVRRTNFTWLKVEKHLQEDILKIPSFLEEGNERFKEDFVRFVALQPMIDGRILDQLYDYVVFKYRENNNYSLKGRNVQRLLDEMEAWHDQVAKEKNPKILKKWNRSEYLEFVEARKKGELEFSVTVRELTNSKELSVEGNRQSHCVGSYANSCVSGLTTIWSVREEFTDGVYEILATVELRGSVVVQVKAKRNSPISGYARNIIERWARMNNISIND